MTPEPLTEYILDLPTKALIATEARFTVQDPVVPLGVRAFSKDIREWKVGDGVTRWSQLVYAPSDRILPADGTGGGTTTIIDSSASTTPAKQVITFGGQSNNVGAAHVALATDPSYQSLPDEYGLDTPAGGLYEISRGDTLEPRYSPAAGLRRSLETRAANMSSDLSLSPSLPFGKRYLELNPAAEELVIVNRAVGNTGFFDNDWNEGDPQFDEALDETRAFMDAHPEHEWMGMVFAAGENDANDRQSKAFYKAAVLAMWTAFKAGMGPHGTNAVLTLTTMSKAWRDIESTAGGLPVTPAHKDEIHQATLELGLENDDIITVLLDDVTVLETLDEIHWGNTNVRSAYREVALKTSQHLQDVSRTAKFPEYRFRFDGDSFTNATGDGGLIHNQRFVEDPVHGAVLTTEDAPGAGTYSGFDTEIKVDQRHYTISMAVAPTVLPGPGTVTFAIGGQNDGTLRWMGNAGARHGTYAGGNPTEFDDLFTVDQWDTVTVTFDGTELNLYFNGALVAGSPQTSDAAVLPGVGDMKLLYFPNLASGTFEGRMKDLIVLPYSLDAAAVAELVAD